MVDHMCKHNTPIAQVFMRLGTTRWGYISPEKVAKCAVLLDKYRWNEENSVALFEEMEMKNGKMELCVKKNEHGMIHIRLFDAWYESPDINKRRFVKTFLERELNGEDKGMVVDLLYEFPPAPGSAPAWSPLRKRSSCVGEIIGQAPKEDDGQGHMRLTGKFIVRMDDTGMDVIVRKGMVKLKSVQREADADRFLHLRHLAPDH